MWSRIITYYTLRNYTFLARVLQALSDPLIISRVSLLFVSIFDTKYLRNEARGSCPMESQ